MPDIQWFNPIGGGIIQEEGEEEWFNPIGGGVIQEDQPAVGGATPHNPFGHPFRGAFAGPIG